MNSTFATDVEVVGKPISAILRRYYRAGNHPSKVRFWNLIRRIQNHRRLTVRYGDSAWLTLDERCFLQRTILTTGSYEPEVYATLLQYAAKEEVVWDIGANIGSFAVLARLDNRVGRLVCCEPDPENRAVLELNLSLNGGTAYEIYPFALCDRREERSFSRGPLTNCGMSRLTGESAPDASTFLVDGRTLDGLVFEDNLPLPTLLKIDVEGWEYQLLLGSERVLRHAPPKAIVFESASDDRRQIQDSRIVELLADYGYSTRPIDRGKASVDSQENFIATRSTN